MFNTILTLFFALLSLGLTSTAIATPAHFSQRPDVHQFIVKMVQRYQFNETALNKLFDHVHLQPTIITSISKPYEDKTWDEYQQLFITKERIDKGVAFWKQNKATLDKAQQIYGVPPDIITAILGVETLYGERPGKYRVIDALATLSFNYPPRSKFFRKELAEFLLLSREQHFNPLIFMGSYAGAIGFPQFMPSNYRRYAIDVSGGNHSDLNHDTNDVIFSIANYFKFHGWKANLPIASPAKISGIRYQQVDVDARIAHYTLRQLIQLGVSPQDNTTQNQLKAGLIRLDRTHQPEYWLGYDNFYVITRYNTSKQYAMAVYQLAANLRYHYYILFEKGAIHA